MLAWLVIRVRTMKKLGINLILSLAIAFAGISVNAETTQEPPCALEYKKVSDDAKICDALDTLKGTIGEFSRDAILGENLTNKPVKVKFYELSSLKPQYANYDALGMKKKNQLFIYINQKHSNAPKEALAALLSHEALHQDEYNSISEETYAWTMEAMVWADLCKRNPELKKNKLSSLANRENILLKMLENANYSNVLIKNTVVNHQGYKSLPQKSPGFEDFR